MRKFNSIRFSPIFDPNPKARLNEVVGQGRNLVKTIFVML